MSSSCTSQAYIHFHMACTNKCLMSFICRLLFDASWWNDAYACQKDVYVDLLHHFVRNQSNDDMAGDSVYIFVDLAHCWLMCFCFCFCFCVFVYIWFDTAELILTQFTNDWELTEIFTSHNLDERTELNWTELNRTEPHKWRIRMRSKICCVQWWQRMQKWSHPNTPTWHTEIYQ